MSALDEFDALAGTPAQQPVKAQTNSLPGFADGVNDLSTHIKGIQSTIPDLVPGSPTHKRAIADLSEAQQELARYQGGKQQTAPIAPAAAPKPTGALAEFDALSSAPSSASPQAKTAASSAAPTKDYSQSTVGKDGSMQSPGFDVVANQLSSLGSTVAGGFRGLYNTGSALLHGKSLEDAVSQGADAVTKTQNDYTFQPRTELGQGVTDALGSKWNPLNWSAKAGEYVGGKLADAGMPGTGAVVNAALTAAPMALGIKGVRSGVASAAGGVADALKPSVEPIPIANRVDPTMSKPRLKLNADGTTTEIPEPTQSAQPLSPNQPVVPGQPSSPSQPSQYAGAGSTGANIIARLGTASEDLRADAMAQIAEAQKTHGPEWGDHVNWDALDRHLNADSLPIPGRLTQGQALQSGPLVSEEWNKRSTNGLGPMFVEQNQVKANNLQAIREQSAPDVNTNSPAEHAQTLMDAYGELHKQEKGVVDAKWTAIRNISSDKIIFDAQSMMDDAQSAIKKAKLSTYDPGGQLSELANGIKAGGFTADEYVAFRQNLGREAMKGGNEGAAASKIIEATNNSKLLPEAKQYQEMVNDALSTGKALHDKLANDPAYNAVAQGTASVKDFINKFVVQGKPEKVANMTNNLVGNDISQQTIRASLLDNLRDKAGLNDKYEGNFATKSFNKGVDFITPNARNVFKNGELQTLRALGDYSSHTTYSGPDSYRNFSNTATELQTPGNAIISKAGGLAATGAETLLAAKTGGMSIPIISALKEGAKARAAARAAIEEQENAANYVHESTRPAAGLIKK